MTSRSNPFLYTILVVKLFYRAVNCLISFSSKPVAWLMIPTSIPIFSKFTAVSFRLLVSPAINVTRDTFGINTLELFREWAERFPETKATHEFREIHEVQWTKQLSTSFAGIWRVPFFCLNPDLPDYKIFRIDSYTINNLAKNFSLASYY